MGRMTDYSRGYAAGLKAAAEVVPTDDTRELCCNGYDCECRKPEDAAFVSAEVEARRIKQAILSLPIVGEADQRGAAADGSTNDQRESGVNGIAQSATHQNSGEHDFAQAVKRLNDGGPYDLTDSPKSYIVTVQRLLAELAERNAPARPGPSQECVVVPRTDLQSLIDSYEMGPEIYPTTEHCLEATIDKLRAMLTAKEEHDAHS